MIVPSLTASSGLALPVLGMGTWSFGGRQTRAPGNDDSAQIALLQQGIEMGYTLIDTAEYYAATYAETLVGTAIKGFDRKKLFLTSKVWKSNARRDDLLRAAEASLKRLGTDYLDCYLYHHFNPEVPLEETMGALNELVEQKMTRSIGVSNFSAALLRRAMACSPAPVVLNQVHCNLSVREALEDLAECCSAHKVILQAWRPVRDLEETPVCREICLKHHITFQQLALAYLFNKKNIAVLAATKNCCHLKENMAALEIKLSAEEMALLDNYPRRRPCDVPLA